MQDPQSNCVADSHEWSNVPRSARDIMDEPLIRNSYHIGPLSLRVRTTTTLIADCPRDQVSFRRPCPIEAALFVIPESESTQLIDVEKLSRSMRTRK